MISRLQVKHVTFYDSDSSFICSTNAGYVKYSSSDGSKIYGYNTRLDPNFLGGIKTTSTFPGANIIAVVPDKDEIKVVHIVDIAAQAIITTISMPDEVTNVQLKRDYVLISTTRKIYAKKLQDFDDEVIFPSCFTHFQSFDSPEDPDSTLIAFLDENTGVVSIADFTDGKIIMSYHAFKSQICSLKFSPTGRKLALVADAGRNVRVYGFPGMKPIASLFRGMTESTILSLSFNVAETWLSLSSSGGTVHVFDLLCEGSDDPSEPTRAAIKLDASNEQMFVAFCLKTGNLRCVSLNGKFLEANLQDPTKPQLNVVTASLAFP